MSVLSGQTIRALGIIQPCLSRQTFTSSDGKTYTSGLGPAGYDLTLDWGLTDRDWILRPGEFALAATQQYFIMPNNVIGMVYDKSSWARRGLSLFNTVIEPGWCGFLTLELTNLGQEMLFLPLSIPIAQVIFQYTDLPVESPYNGKYQNQSAGPQKAI